jgi:hypothetical protein
MTVFNWQDIDHRLVILKLTDLAEEMRSQIKVDERRIRLENRGNLNRNTVPSLVLKMKRDRADEWAGRVYEIYCNVWQTQGYVKSAGFVRAVCARGIVPTLRARAEAIASEFAGVAIRTSFPVELHNAHLQSLRLNMLRLEGRWRRRLEIEAKECEHAERRATLAHQNIQGRNVARKETPIGGAPEGSRQIPARGNRQKVQGPRGGPSTGKAGRRPKLGRAFVECAGRLWQRATSDGYNSVPVDKLRQIASALDAAEYLPPSAYLEGKYGIELRAFNSRNSNSKLGPIKTWSHLISCGDKDHLRGMRRLLSRVPRSWMTRIRCPEINSGQKISSYPTPFRLAAFSDSRCPPYVFADNEALPKQIDSGLSGPLQGAKARVFGFRCGQLMTSTTNLGTKTAQDSRASSIQPGTSGGKSGIVFAEANTGNPLRGDFERMARRRFQDPTPRRRGDWWTIHVRQDVFVGGKLKRINKRVRLAPAMMPDREVRIHRRLSSGSCSGGHSFRPSEIY